MMRKFAACALLVVSAAAMADSHGTIKICRYGHIVDMDDKKRIPIPSKSPFDVDLEDKAHSKSKISLRTTEDVTLPPKPGCVVVQADIVSNPGNEILSPNISPRFVFSGAQISGTGLSNTPRIPTLQAYAVTQFK